MSKRRPVTTVSQGCDQEELRRVVSSLPPGDLTAWSRGDTDVRVPAGCSSRQAAQAARAEQRRRQHAQAARAAARATDGPDDSEAGPRASTADSDATEARQPTSIDLPVVGSVRTDHAFLAAVGAALLVSGTDGGAALAMPGGPDPDTVGSHSNGVPTVKSIDTEGDFFGVRFRQPGRFVKVRTPAWAADVAGSVSKGAKVRMGRTDAGNWFVQSVLIEKAPGKDAEKAEDLARRIVRKIEDADGDGDADAPDEDTDQAVPTPRSGEDRTDFMGRCLSATNGDMAACAAAWDDATP